jgi:hypothetical protein
VPTTEAASTTHTVSCGVNDNLMGRGLAAGIVLLRTNRLTVEASADGWRKVSAELDTDWSTPAVTFITGTSVNPAKGTASTSKDELIWRRRGEMVQLRVNFKKVGVADDSSGTGAYRIACPFACATSQVTLDGLGLGVTTIDTHGICQVGNGSFTSSTPALATAIAVMASTATIQLSDTATYLGSVTTSMAGAMSFYFEASYPVANW